jgi:hypothetical protein
MACSAIAWSFVETIGDLEVSLIFPSSRTLYPTSPSLRWVAWASLPHPHRYYARLRLPFAPLGFLCFRSSTDTWLRPLALCVLSSSSLRVGRLPATPGLFGRPGPPYLPALLSRKQMALPSFQTIPLSACPALRPRWCPAHSP